MCVNDRYIAAETVEVCRAGVLLQERVRAHTRRSEALAAARHAAVTSFAAVRQPALA
jgi:hypothetical protein